MRSFHFPGRSLVYGRRAMCATSHPAASLACIEVLRQGGNAVDAAIATAAVLAVVEPHMTGIGGDCFALIAKPGTRKPIALNASGRAPKAATAAWLAKAGLARIEPDSPHAVTVPGAIGGWMRLLEDHGTWPHRAPAAAGHRAGAGGLRGDPAGRGRLAAQRRQGWAAMPGPGSICSRPAEVARGGRHRALSRRWPPRSSASPGTAATASTRASRPRTWWPS